VKIPADARPTASPQASVEDRKGPLVSVGPNRLVTPLLSSAMVLVSTAIAYPPPPTYAQVSVPPSPTSTATRVRTYRRIPGGRRTFSTWWQVKDSNLRSFRDGFTDQRPQARDQRKRPFHRQLTCVFPTDTRRQPGPTGHFWVCTRSPWSRWRPGSAS
jgi:hypothetical protein